MQTPRIHRVRRLNELRAIASPQRQDIAAAIEALQPCSVVEIGRHLGRLPVSLYYHIRKLEMAGLVAKERTDEGGARYRLPGRQLKIDPERRGKREMQAIRKIGAGMFRRAQRLHDLSVEGRADAEHNLSQRTVRMSSSGCERVRKKIRELLDTISEEERKKGKGTFYTITTHIARNPAHQDFE